MGATKQPNVNSEQLEISETEKTGRLGIRHFQACLMFGGLVFGYFLRVNMSVAIVSMVTPEVNPSADHYDWNNQKRNLILSSFFWGYVVAQLPSGLLAHKFGAKIVLALSTAICAICTVMIPWAATFGDYISVCFLRVLIGLTQGVVYPCVHTLLAKWVPSTERGFLSTFVYSGAQLGTVMILATSGIMSESQFGWPSIFYVSGIVAFAWSVIYFFLGADSPSDLKYISKYEREYIESLTGSSNQKHMKIPWSSMFTSVPFIALIFAHCGFTWGFYTLLTQIPSYLGLVLNLKISDNGLLSALPYFAMWILCLVISPINDILINRGIISVEFGRKLFNTIGQWGPMLALIALGYMTKEHTILAIILLTIGVGLNAASLVGYLVNHMDLAPNFAGTMMGITNGISNLLSVFAPLFVGKIVIHESDPAEWRIVFFTTAGFYLVCNLVFIIFGKASIQPWNEQNSTIPIDAERNRTSTENNQKF